MNSKKQSCKPITTTHYKSFDDFLVSLNSSLSENDLNTAQNDKCTSFIKRNRFTKLPLAPNYPGDLWSIFGDEGGVFKVLEYDVSLYIENFTMDEVENLGMPRLDDQERSLNRFYSLKRSKSFNKSSLDQNGRNVYQPCLRPKDGRIVIKLEENINDEYIKKERIVSDSYTKALKENIHFESAGPLVYLCISFR